MTVPSARALAAMCFLLVLAPALAACTADAPIPSASPSATGSGSTPTPVVDAPTPRLAAGCADLASVESLAPVLSEPVEARDPAAVALTSMAGMPYQYPVRSLGGLVCEWSNGQPPVTDTGAASGYIGARVSVLPEAEAQWKVFAGTYLVANNEQLYCTNVAPVACTLDALVNGSWVEATMTGFVVDASLPDEQVRATSRTFFDPIVEAISAAGQPAAPWTPAADTLALPSDCDGFITPAQVQAALGTDAELRTGKGGGGWSQYAAAFTDTGSLPCTWLVGNGDLDVGTLRWLPGGEWAALDAVTLALMPSTAEQVTVAGLEDGDQAYVRCIPGDEECWIDLIVGGNWIQVSVSREYPGSPVITVDRRSAAVNIAETIITTIRG